MKDRIKCDWCGSPGKRIGHDYGCSYIWKCTKCHHEWVIVEEYPVLDLKESKQDKP